MDNNKQDSRWNIRANIRDKNVIKKIAEEKEMSVSDYIRFKLFEGNSDYQKKDEYVYEASVGSKHNYVTFGTVYFNHFLLREIVAYLCPDNQEEIIDRSLANATAKINKLGYSKNNRVDKRGSTNA
jgi:hypothetical protein